MADFYAFALRRGGETTKRFPLAILLTSGHRWAHLKRHRTEVAHVHPRAALHPSQTRARPIFGTPVSATAHPNSAGRVFFINRAAAQKRQEAG